MTEIQARLIIFAQKIDLSPLPQTDASSAKIQTVLSLIFATTGAIAVMMVVIGGIKFAGSQGDPQGTAKARNTIIYAVIGLIVSILASVIVRFVLTRVAP